MAPCADVSMCHPGLVSPSSNQSTAQPSKHIQRGHRCLESAPHSIFHLPTLFDVNVPESVHPAPCPPTSNVHPQGGQIEWAAPITTTAAIHNTHLRTQRHHIYLFMTLCSFRYEIRCVSRELQNLSNQYPSTQKRRPPRWTDSS